MELPKRKTVRLKGYDYSTPGAYFITICVKDRKHLLSEIVGTGVPDGPENRLKPYGEVAERYLNSMCDFYNDIKIEKYVIMPNHIHMIILITEKRESGGPPGTSVPTNATVSQFISTFKRFCNREYGRNIWQARSNDHIIRGKDDYRKIWEYIDTNVLRWETDCFYKNEKDR